MCPSYKGWKKRQNHRKKLKIGLGRPTISQAEAHMKLSPSLTDSTVRLGKAALMAAVLCGVAGWFAVAAHPAAAQAPAGLEVRSLSTRPDLVTGGDVLVQVKRPVAVAAGTVTILVNGRNVTPTFKSGREANTLVGLVRDLPLGQSHVEASAKGQRPAQLTIVNHPIVGPVF